MESTTIGVDDLFDIDDDVEEYDAVPPMPDLESDMPTMEEDEHANKDEEGNDVEVLAKLKEIKGAAKKRVLRPQPKLDETRLNGERGLPVLMKTFQGVKFKGKGHEASDLKLMMNKLEHWAHRLFPKMTFDEVIDRVEKLGVKREVKTCLKRIRLDMPMIDGEVLTEKDDEFDGSKENDPFNEENAMDAEAAYDEMVRQEREAMELQEKEEESSQEPFVASTPQHSQRSPSANTLPNSSQILSTPKTPTAQEITKSQGLTPEQKERLERNKLRALEKRAARLGVPLSALLPPKLNTENDTTNCQTSLNHDNTSDVADSSPVQAEERSILNESKHDETGGVCQQTDVTNTTNFNSVNDSVMLNKGQIKEMEEISSGSNEVERDSQRQVKTCSEPVMESIQDNEMSSMTPQNKPESTGSLNNIQNNTVESPLMDKSFNIVTNTSEGCNRNENSKIPIEECAVESHEHSDVVKTPVNEMKKGSCDAEDLKLHFSESDTTNTTQEEDMDEDVETFKE